MTFGNPDPEQLLGVPSHEVDQVMAAAKEAAGADPDPRVAALAFILGVLEDGITAATTVFPGTRPTLERLIAQALDVLGVTAEEIRQVSQGTTAAQIELDKARQRARGETP